MHTGFQKMPLSTYTTSLGVAVMIMSLPGYK